MYRMLKVEVGAADDTNFQSPIYGPRTTVATQTRDLLAFSGTARIAPSASQAAIAITPVVTGYFLSLSSDYPVRVRINDVAGTQFTLKSNNVAAVATGAPAPDQCVFVMTGAITSLYLQPISGATSTANVRILVTGDPASSYD